MTISRPSPARAFTAITVLRHPVVACAILAAASLATPAAADDPAPSQIRPNRMDGGLEPALPRPGAVLDAMPIMRLPPAARAERAMDPGPIEVEATGTTGAPGGETLVDPGLGERPTPREALQESELGETIMRPRGGSASGGKPDVPPER